MPTNETENFTKTFGIHVDVLMKSKNLIEDKQSVGGYFHHFCDLSKYLGAEIGSLHSLYNISLFTLAKFAKSRMNQPTPSDILITFLRTSFAKHAPTLA